MVAFTAMEERIKMNKFRIVVGSILGIVFILPALFLLLIMITCAVPLAIMVVLVVYILPEQQDVVFGTCNVSTSTRNWEALKNDGLGNKKIS